MVKIEMHDVWLHYGRRPVLKGITLEVQPGEMVALIGPNGSGKSTVIKALSRVIPHHSGRITVDGSDVSAIPRRDLARLLAVVPQMPLLPSAFTAFEIVLMGRNPHLGLLQHEGPRDFAITWQAMERTRTQSLAKRHIGELSGGEIQCLLIARVLAQESKAILLDEPTANLDIGRQVEILDLIKDLAHEKNLAIMAALHDLNLAAQYCDRLVLISQGQVQAEGTPAQVITQSNISEVYGAENCVYTHPTNGLPMVLLNPGNGHASRSKTEEKT